MTDEKLTKAQQLKSEISKIKRAIDESDLNIITDNSKLLNRIWNVTLEILNTELKLKIQEFNAL